MLLLQLWPLPEAAAVARNRPSQVTWDQQRPAPQVHRSHQIHDHRPAASHAVLLWRPSQLQTPRGLERGQVALHRLLRPRPAP